MMTKQAQTEIELIRQGAFSIYKKANVHPSHWEALLDMQSTKTAQTLLAMEKKEKVAAFLKSLPVIKQAMTVKKAGTFTGTAIGAGIGAAGLPALASAYNSGSQDTADFANRHSPHKITINGPNYPAVGAVGAGVGALAGLGIDGIRALMRASEAKRSAKPKKLRNP